MRSIKSKKLLRCKFSTRAVINHYGIFALRSHAQHNGKINEHIFNELYVSGNQLLFDFPVAFLSF